MGTGFRWGAAGLVLGISVASMLPALAQQQPQAQGQRTVRATGVGTIRSAPDQAVVYVGVQTDATQAQEALRDNAAKMQSVIEAIMDSGVRRDDISTSTVSLNPRYDNEGISTNGFTAVNQVLVTVRNLDQVGKVIDRSVAAGANVTNGIEFRISDQDAGLNQALAAAVADARSKAEALATAAGARLGEVVSVQEDAVGGIPPVYDAREAAATPVVPPTLEAQVSVTVAWALG